MATFSYNQNSSDSINVQWNDYLRSNTNVYDKEGIITQNQQEYISLFKHLSDEQKKACQKVCGNLDVDFYEINKYIDELRIYSYPYGEIDNTPSMIDWKHSMIIEEQHIKHYINGLSHYLQIMEIDNQRINSIRNGLEHLIHAF